MLITVKMNSCFRLLLVTLVSSLSINFMDHEGLPLAALHFTNEVLTMHFRNEGGGGG